MKNRYGCMAIKVRTQTYTMQHNLISISTIIATKLMKT